MAEETGQQTETAEEQRTTRREQINNMDGTKIAKNGTLYIENILEKEKKERKENEEKLIAEAAIRVEAANFNTIRLATPERATAVNTATIRNRFNFGTKAKNMVSITISNNEGSSSSSNVNRY